MPKKRLSKKEEERVLEMSKKVGKFLESPEGQKVISEAMGKAAEFLRQLSLERKVTWKQMHTPVDF